MPDHFDRLLARYAGDALLLRPRLPGPFERIEALRTEPPQEREPAPLRTPTPPPSPAGEVRREREIRTTEQVTTVVRTETPPTGELRSPESAPRVPVPQPFPRPVPPLVRAADTERGKPVEPQRVEHAQPPRTEPSSTGLLRADVPDPVADAARPRSPAPAPRAAAPAARRQDQRPPERVVHVEIGRLEVTAARPERPAAPGRAQRREPALSLEDYLSRDARGN